MPELEVEIEKNYILTIHSTVTQVTREPTDAWMDER